MSSSSSAMDSTEVTRSFDPGISVHVTCTSAMGTCEGGEGGGGGWCGCSGLRLCTPRLTIAQVWAPESPRPKHTQGG